MSSEELGRILDEEEKRLKEMLTAHEVVEQERLGLQREILEKQLKKKGLDMSLSQSGTNIKKQRIEINLAKSKFWAEKNSLG